MDIRDALALAEAQRLSSERGAAETEALLTEARLNLERTASLEQRQLASDAELDRARALANSLEAQLARKKADVEVAERQVDGTWRYTITDPDNGWPLSTGTTRRRPTAAQHQEVTTRNRTCIFPGCRMPARDCDLDHRIPWAEGGRTRAEDLWPLCRYDHGVRHAAGWTYKILPNGAVEWDSRLGHIYRTGESSGLPP